MLHSKGVIEENLMKRLFMKERVVLKEPGGDGEGTVGSCHHC